MKLPKLSDIWKVCKGVGGNPPDPISGATVFDEIRWNIVNGKIWNTPVIASDLGNIRFYDSDVCKVATVGAGHITPDKVVAGIARCICPHSKDGGPCPASKSGYPVCDILPLCKWAQEVKDKISNEA